MTMVLTMRLECTNSSSAMVECTIINIQSLSVDPTIKVSTC
jgi:hypothetical protein